MPVEIRELVIKATVEANGASDGKSSSSASTLSEQDGVEAIVNTCVEKVLEILKEKNGR